ncbi:MAG: S8 family serine peptidase [Nitriliruptoraceae bacterium]
MSPLAAQRGADRIRAALVLTFGALVLALPADMAAATAAPSLAEEPPDDSRAAVPAADRVVVLWRSEASRALRRQVLDLAGPATATARDIDTVTVAAGSGPATARRLSDHPAVEIAEVDQPVRLAVDPVSEAPALAPRPDDPLFPQQWALENTGQLLWLDGWRARVGVDVNVREAWAVTRGSPQVTVAVIDSGVELTHPDLEGAFWQNPGELLDGRDTNGNGYVDDVNGWDLVAGRPIVAADPTSTVAEAHGTQVASLIAARSDDDVGMSGVAPEVRIMPIRAFAETSTATGAGVSTIELLIRAIDYAVANGADVINASWESATDSAVLERVIADAGTPVVAAAGNRSLDLEVAGVAVPAGFDLPNLIAVTAIDPAGAIPSFATVGASTIDLAAPGVGIVAATVGGGYTELELAPRSGTSYAVPHVSGALALGRGVAPTTSTSDLLDTLMRTTVAQESLAGSTTTGGRLDVGAFLRELDRPVCGAESLPAGFDDVDVTDVHAPAIDCLVELEVAAGYPDGTFRPSEPVTRGQFASLVAGLLAATDGLPVGAPDAFRDDDGSVHEPAIDALASLDLLRGDDEGSARPDLEVTRGQVAAMLVRTTELLDGAEREATRSWFPDAVGSTHADAIDVARDLGLVRGRNRVNYDASTGTSRDEVASVLARTLDALGRAGIDIPFDRPLEESS